jgi:V8-like Glu-specific endopeptidase
LKRTILRIAGILLLGAVSSAAQAEVVAPAASATGQSSGTADWSALQEIVGAERKLTSLPRSMFSFSPPPGNPGTPQAIAGNVGAAGDTALAAPITLAPPVESPAGGKNLNTIYAYAEAAIDLQARDNYPYSSVGHYAFVSADGESRRCTAALISRSIAVTAGQCVHQGGDKPGRARTDGWNRGVGSSYGYFVPSRDPGDQPGGPYGYAAVHAIATTDGWFNSGLVNQGYDVALLILRDRAGTTSEIGEGTGWLGFCYANCLQPYRSFAQIGYPANYYAGAYMMQGHHLARNVNNTDYYFGSGMQGGSSGGPQIADLDPLSSGTPGAEPRNVVFAVTSWGFADETYRIQGASSLSGPGNNNNFPELWNAACEVAKGLHGAATCALLP